MSSGGGGDSGANQRAEEARKAALRQRIDSLYGIAPGGSRPAPVAPSGGGGFSKVLSNAMNAQVPAQAAAYDANTAAASDAATQMADEQTKLADSTRGYYTDQLARSFGVAERNTRFNLARQGLMGGSSDVDANRELQTDQNLGATRIDEAARRVVSQLQGQREQERLNAVNLVNAGAGDDAVLSAQAGLKNSLDNVSTQQKANLFGDLFTSGADAFASQNYNAAMAAQLARFQSQLGAYFPTRSSGGAVTPSG